MEDFDGDDLSPIPPSTSSGGISPSAVVKNGGNKVLNKNIALNKNEPRETIRNENAVPNEEAIKKPISPNESIKMRTSQREEEKCQAKEKSGK